MRNFNINQIEKYYAKLHNDKNEITNLLDAVTTNKTNFFREQKHWSYLSSKILPRVNTNKFRVWSAACSTGEEPYTIGMVMKNRLNDTNINDFSVLGTDINNDALYKANHGQYSKKTVAKIKDHKSHYVSDYFNKEDDCYHVKKKIKRHVKFRRFNLKRDQYPFSNYVDLIVCRNVFIYFNNTMIEHVVEELTQSLKRGGYLFIGHTENLNEIDHDLTKIKTAIYQKQ